MTQVTLRRAHAIVMGLIAEVDKQQAELAATASSVLLDELDELDTVMEVRSSRQRDILKSITATIHAVTWMRSALARANHISGISNLLTELSSLEKLLLAQAVVAGADIANPARAKLELNRLRASSDTQRPYLSTRVVVNTTTQEAADAAQNEVRELKLAKARIKDELLRLNLVTQIELPEDISNLAEKYSLLVG